MSGDDTTGLYKALTAGPYQLTPKRARTLIDRWHMAFSEKLNLYQQVLLAAAWEAGRRQPKRDKAQFLANWMIKAERFRQEDERKARSRQQGPADPFEGSISEEERERRRGL
ncbi:MAG: hypothetical protein GY700_06480 [Propionibacteriaceae bacterium]|nr:hypothetical protein [Propionibacteriaceae bacterium]